jgi:uncharacterized protein (PEP-CTERM system associated)
MAPKRLITQRLASLTTLLAAIALSMPPHARAEPWRVVPQVSVNETFTDNADLSVNAIAKSSLVSTISAALRAERVGPRATVFVDYTFQQLLYSQLSRLNTRQNYLASRLSTEVIDNWLFIEARANISQENRSAFLASDSSGGTTTNRNRSETRTVQLSPYVRGQLADAAIYQLRVNATESESDSATLPNTRSLEWLGRIRNASLAAKLGWSLDVNSLQVRNTLINKKEDSRASASLIYAINPQFHVSLIGGRERTDFASIDKQSQATYGIGVEYSPTPRSQLLAARETRFFGSSYSVSASHRTPQTAWRFSSNREAIVLPNQLATGASSTITGLMNDLLTASIQDPAARAEAVRRRFESLGTTGSQASIGEFLTERPFINSASELSVAVLGARNRLTLAVTRTARRSFDIDPVGASSFAISNNIRRDNATVAWVHRLTPLTALSVNASRLRATGEALTNPESEQKQVSVAMTTALGPRTDASFGARHVRFETNTANNFRENAVVGTLAMRF